MRYSKSRNLHHRSSIFTFIVFLHFSCTTFLIAQQYLTTFGQLTEIKTQRNPIAMMSADFNGDGTTDLATMNTFQVRFYFQFADSFSSQPKMLFVKRPIIVGKAAKLNRDKFTDLILIVSDPPGIEVYLSKKRGGHSLVWAKELAEPFENFIVADINSDRRPDLIFFGKKHLGATVHLGNGNGSFQNGIILFPEYSFSTMNVATLHDMGTTDILATNWLSNELLIFSGSGKLNFSDPTVLAFSTEPLLLLTDNLNNDGNTDLVVGLPSENRIQTFTGDGFGRLLPLQSIKLKNSPSALLMGDCNNNQSNDLAVLSASSNSVTIKLNDGSGLLGDDIPFYAGKAPTQFTLFSHAGQKFIDAAVLDTASEQIRIYHNSIFSVEQENESVYATGIKPNAIIVDDVNRDGWDDLIVGNTGSSTLSLYLNEGEGSFRGQIPFPFLSGMDNLHYFQNKDSIAVILSVSSGQDAIAVMELNPRNFSQTIYTIPVQGKTDILKISQSTFESQLRIFALERDNKSQHGTIIQFERIKGNRFIEKSYPLSPAIPISSATIGNYDGSRSFQLVYSAFDKKRGKIHLFLTKLLPTDELESPRNIHSFDATVPYDIHTAVVDLNKDKLDDLLINLGEPENKLYIFMGKDDTTLMLKKNGNITMTIPVHAKMKTFDVNADGLLDLVYEDKFNKSINVRHGKGNGTFSNSVQLASTGDIGSFEITDLDNDSIPELTVTDVLNGTVKIIRLHN